ncbi:MAG: hypothetical protein K9M80_09645 [Candidatus Marinimicrobia bacterium]|nr:hypothetical protein [Candidatus Neomarinimicrobiota bacterium]
MSKEDNLSNVSHVEDLEYKPGLKALLNWVAGILVIALILAIYLPSLIWKEEEKIIQEGRYRMKNLQSAEEFYNQMTDDYMENPDMLLDVVSAARDSNRADSNFTGAKTISLEDTVLDVKVPSGFYRSFDTTFAESYRREETVVDTICTVLKWNPQLVAYDTLFVNSTNLGKIDYDTLITKETQERQTTNTYYNRYYLTDKFTHRPLTKDKYIIESDSSDLLIKDPLDYVYKEPRFLVFTLKDSSHGYIKNGEPSWK